ncbi:YgjV family protein, partial [Acinetobacter baumannii]|nr:YgjV family protein [Acinetobacter baumannii]
CSTACWVTHNLWLGSIGGTPLEGSFLIVNGLNIIRFRLMQKRGFVPFKVANAVQEESPSAP